MGGRLLRVTAGCNAKGSFVHLIAEK